MHQTAIHELTDDIVEKAVALFGLDPGSQKRLGSFERAVFKCSKSGGDLALHLTHSTHRTEGQVLSEFHWMDYLANSGACITMPKPSAQGRLTERLDTPSGFFIVSAQSWAEGECPDPKDSSVWNGDLFKEWGAVTGCLHRLTRGYAPPSSIEQRPFEKGLVGWEHPGLSDDALRVLSVHEAVSREIAGLPRTPDTFGLCHTDIHQWNFHVHGGRMIVFDFDDCSYDSLVGDIAIALYYSTIFGSGLDPSDSKGLGDYGENFLMEFMKGYRSEYRLPEELLCKLPLFVLRRQTLLYLIMQGLEPVGNRQAFLEASQRSALDGTPIFDMDYDPSRYA